MYGPVVLAALCLLVHVDYARAYPKSLFGSSSLHLNILHTNDIHSRILESDQWGGECGERRRDRSKCFGGVARIAQKVREIKSSRRNTLFLNAGGFFQGTLWYSTLKHKIATYAMSRMGYDVIGLGNNEFDDGPKELAPFVREMRKSGVAVVGTNVDVSREPHFKGVPLSRSHVITISGVRVALLAVVPKETEIFSRPGHVRILPLAESINKETWRLRQQGVKIFILISQAGFEADKRLAVACPELDVIVGGHSETFLYSGPPPLQEDARRVRGPYPFLVSRKGRRSCVIVQSYRYGKYLGNLEVLFNRKGEITHWRGRPILLDQSVGQDPLILRGLMPFKRAVDDALKKVVGSTKVLLEASHKVCRVRECNLGNLITDSFFDYYANKKSKVSHAWSEVNAAVINGGTVRESIGQNSKVILQDLQRAMPIDNELILLNMNGSQLHQMFQHAVSSFGSGPSHNGKFLQVSGIRVTYDIGRPSGWRVARLRILCTNCTVPRYEDVDFQKRYTIVTTSFIANGGDGFKFDKGVLKRSEGVSAFNVFTKYFTKLSPIKTAEEGRIVVKNRPSKGQPSSPAVRPTPGTVPGQTQVPGSVPGQSQISGSGPGQPQSTGPTTSQLGPGQPSSTVPASGPLGPGQSPSAGLPPSQYGQAQPSSTVPASGPLGPGQSPSAGLPPSQYGQAQPSSTMPPSGAFTPGQPQSTGPAPSQYGQAQPPSTVPASGPFGQSQAQSTGPIASQFGQNQPSSTGPGSAPFVPGQPLSTGTAPSQFSQGQPSNTVSVPGAFSQTQTPSTGPTPSQFVQGQPPSTVSAPGAFGQVQTTNIGPATTQLGQGQLSGTAPAPGSFGGQVQAPSTGPTSTQFGQGPSENAAPAPAAFGQIAAPSTGSPTSQFGEGQPSPTGPASGPFGPAPAPSAGSATGSFGQGQQLQSTGPAPVSFGSVQPPSQGPGISQFGQVPPSSTGSASGPVPQAPSTGLLPGQFGQAQAPGTGPAQIQLGQVQSPSGRFPLNQLGQVQSPSTGQAPGQFGLGQATNSGFTPGPTQSPAFIPGQAPITVFGQSQTPTAGIAPSQAPNAVLPAEPTGAGGWSSA